MSCWPRKPNVPPSSFNALAANVRTFCLSHQSFPRARDRFTKTHDSGHKDVRLAGFNLLHGAHIQLGPLREQLLRNSQGHPFAPKVRAKTLQYFLRSLVA